ncbi:MAG TPA: hypothetical protein PLO69_09510 [Gammaproteobacteria bacterium]|nr:hypothetical protein [Gammaproteobacteria bacterium]
MLKNRITAMRKLITAAALLLLFSDASAALFLAYPGVYPAKVVSVESANIVVLSTNVWTGYSKTFRVTLRDVEVPQDTPAAPVCQRTLAAKALEFTQKFLSNATNVQLRDIQMEDTASKNAVAPIFTEQGSLADALKQKGLGRPPGDKPGKPWC